MSLAGSVSPLVLAHPSPSNSPAVIRAAASARRRIAWPMTWCCKSPASTASPNTTARFPRLPSKLNTVLPAKSTFRISTATTPRRPRAITASSPRRAGFPVALRFITRRINPANRAFSSRICRSGERRNFTAMQGVIGSPAVSPDGRKVALVLARSGSVNIYVRDADGSNLKQLTFTREDNPRPAGRPMAAGFVSPRKSTSAARYPGCRREAGRWNAS